MVGAGCRIGRLLVELERQGGCTLSSLGLITRQTIAGAISTGTHGSGRNSMSHDDEGVRVARYDTATGAATLETMRRIRDEFGVNMTCGASNTSFGMPDRHTLNSVWLPMAMTQGLTSAIMDARTPQIVDAVKAADVFMNHDEWGMAWIAAHRAKAAASS